MTVQSYAPTRHPRMLEFVRYLATSVLALGADFALFALSMRAGVAYPVAACLGFVVGLAVAYFLSVRWAFTVRTVHDARTEFAVFAGVGVAGLLLTESLLWIEIHGLGMNPLWAKIGAAGCVFLFNFTVRKALLFSRRTGLSRSVA